MDKSTQMQAYISTSRLVAFNIHPKQHYVMENQRIMRDEEETVYIPGSSSKKKSSLSFLKEFLSAIKNSLSLLRSLLSQLKKVSPSLPLALGK